MSELPDWLRKRMMLCYHFTAATLRNGDPIPAIGQWLEYTGKIVPCKSGLHASEHPFDALEFAPGNILHRVELEGELQSHGDPIDKWVGRRRRIIATIDAKPLLREYARWCATRVLHLWDSPPVVREYLATGDESLRAAAGAAAWEAARVAAWAAAWEAREAGDAAWDAARTTQRDHFAAMVEAAFADQGETK